MDERAGEQILQLRAEGLSWRLLEGEVVALDLRSSTYLTANKTGALLWEALARGATREELVARLVEEYGLAQGQAREDVDAFLTEADARNLLS